MIIGLMQPAGPNEASSELSLLLSKIYKLLGKENFNPGALHAFGRRFAVFNSAESLNPRPQLHIFSTPEIQLALLSDASPSSGCLDKPELKLKPDTPLEWNLPGRWITAGIPKNEFEPILWSSDPLGAQWLYFTETHQGTIFSNDFHVICLLAPAAGEIDPVSLRHALVLGYMFDAKTFHPAIRLAPPGCIFEWKNGGFRIHRFHRIKYGDALAGKSNKAKTDAVIAAFESAAEGWKKVLPKRTVISLSAGLDSRTALGYLHRAGLNMPCFTFGHPSSVEVEGAASIAAIVGATTQVFPVPDISWKDWEVSTLRLGTIGQIQSSGWAQAWLDYIGQKADAVVHGYLGDALTGKHLSSCITDSSDWSSYWTNWSVDPFWHDWPGIRKEWRKNLVSDIEAEFRAEISGIDVAFSHQQALHLDLYCRQRRWVASQPNELGQIVLPACFFYHPDVLEVWANLPITDLRRQVLYHRANHQVFPNLFPRQSTAPFILAQRIIRRMLRILNLHAPDSLSESRRPRVIEKSRIIASARAEAVERILEVQNTVLDKIVDIKYVIEKLENINRDMPSESECIALIRIINAAHLLVRMRKEKHI